MPDLAGIPARSAIITKCLIVVSRGASSSTIGSVAASTNSAMSSAWLMM